MSNDIATLQQALEQWLRELAADPEGLADRQPPSVFGVRDAAPQETVERSQVAIDVRIENLKRMPGGASQELWQFDAVAASRAWHSVQALVLRRPLGGKIYPDALDLEREYRVLQVAYRAGVPAPRPFAFRPDLLGRPAILTQRLEGETIGRRIVRDATFAEARQTLPSQMGMALARIHAVDLDAAQLRAILPAPPPRAPSPAQWLLSQLEQSLDAIGEPHPAIELGLRWLRRHEPAVLEPLVLCHGDFRIGNLVVNTNGLVGVLDWEFAHIGDAYEDLAWPLVRDWRFGMDHLRLGGIAQPDAFLAAYAQQRGCSVDHKRLYYWEVMGNVRWAMGMLNQAQRHLSGQEPNLEFASLGRRCAEVEWEVLRLIG